MGGGVGRVGLRPLSSHPPPPPAPPPPGRRQSGYDCLSLSLSLSKRPLRCHVVVIPVFLLLLSFAAGYYVVSLSRASNDDNDNDVFRAASLPLSLSLFLPPPFPASGEEAPPLLLFLRCCRQGNNFGGIQPTHPLPYVKGKKGEVCVDAFVCMLPGRRRREGKREAFSPPSLSIRCIRRSMEEGGRGEGGRCGGRDGRSPRRLESTFCPIHDLC